MSELEITIADPLHVGDRVELLFPARGDLVVLARLVTAAISARAGFDIEELEDLRLAVGELCLLAMGGGDDHHGDLRLEFTVTAEDIEVSCTLAGATGATGVSRVRAEASAEADQLGEQILSALVDDYGREQDDGSSRSWLRKRRTGHVA